MPTLQRGGCQFIRKRAPDIELSVLNTDGFRSWQTLRDSLIARNWQAPRRDANSASEASGTTLAPRFRAAPTGALRESSMFRSVAMVTHVSAAVAAQRSAARAPESLRTPCSTPPLLGHFSTMDLVDTLPNGSTNDIERREARAFLFFFQTRK